MTDKIDYKKQFPDLYSPKTTPMLIEIPEMNFVAVRGAGNPNAENGEYKQALNLLCGISFTIKMSKMSGDTPPNYHDFAVPPLEGLWWLKGGGVVTDITDKENFEWISMILLPEFVTREVFAWAKEKLAAKKPELNAAKAEFFPFAEGKCAQVMHIGPYDDEPATIAKLDKFIAEQDYKPDFTEVRRHHEIYLSDPRKCAPERLKTVIRYPIAKK